MPLSLLALPWRWAERPSADATADGADAGRLLVFASRFDGRGLRTARVMLGGGMTIWREARRAPGCIGASLWARPHLGRYYTFSAWRDEDSLRAFVTTARHRDGVRALHDLGQVDGVLISWWEDAAGWRPKWRDVVRRVNASPTGPYAGPEAG